MTKKDYKAIADVIKNELDLNIDNPNMPINYNCRLILKSVARDLATIFQSKDNKFDRDEFLAICGLCENQGDSGL
jgi:hypothetical protein